MLRIHHASFGLSLLLALSCSDSSSLPASSSSGGSAAQGGNTASCTPGTDRCDCYGNGTCNAGLECLSNLCVALSKSTGGAPSTSVASGAGGSTTAPSGGSGGSSGAAASFGGAVTVGGGASVGGAGARGGTTGSGANLGGSAIVTTSAGGSTSVTTSTLTNACQQLLETLNPGNANACSMSSVAIGSSSANVLVLLDKSGSMTQIPAGDTKTKWAGALDAVKMALNNNDSFIKYGLMLFPYLSDGTATTCELETGDVAVNVPVGSAALTVDKINALVAATTPSGGTPTAAALRTALDYYTKGGGAGLAGAKYVLLVTDGGPNCNSDLACGPDSCTANLDRTSSCGTGVPNCCDPAIAVTGRPLPGALCVDDLAVSSAINALRGAGIKTFVVGIPGTEAYANHLDSFAVAGGAPVTDPGATSKYYQVINSASLASTLTRITSSLVQTCTVPLTSAPADKLKLNLAIDCSPIPQATAGTTNWHYNDNPNAPAIIIDSAQCGRIQSTAYNRVDVVTGCPTVVLL